MKNPKKNTMSGRPLKFSSFLRFMLAASGTMFLLSFLVWIVWLKFIFGYSPEMAADLWVEVIKSVISPTRMDLAVGQAKSLADMDPERVHHLLFDWKIVVSIAFFLVGIKIPKMMRMADKVDSFLEKKRRN